MRENIARIELFRDLELDKAQIRAHLEGVDVELLHRAHTHPAQVPPPVEVTGGQDTTTPSAVL